MTTSPIHTPYDGSSPLFTIGLKPLDLHDWIDTDHNLLRYLDEKDRIATRHPQEMFAALPDTRDAQAEVLHLLADHLPKRFPDTYSRFGPQIDVVPAFRRVMMDAHFIPPLLIAAGLVQEDLILLRKQDDGWPKNWSVVAGALAFPSSWRLLDKIGKPMHDVHAPVPGFNEGTRNAALIERIFDNLRGEAPVVRWNWSLYGDDKLYHPESANPSGRRFGEGELAENVFLRLERQTLRKLPESGDILFTIRIYIDPLEALERQPNAPELAAALIHQIEALTPEQLAYKGLSDTRAQLIGRLNRIAHL